MLTALHLHLTGWLVVQVGCDSVIRLNNFKTTIVILLRELFEALEVLDPPAAFLKSLVFESTRAALGCGVKKPKLNTLSTHML